MHPKRPSSAFQRSQTFRVSEEKPQNSTLHHQGLLNLAKPIILSRPQTAKFQQNQSSSTLVSHPCLTDSKSLLSEKEINIKLQECLKADVFFFLIFLFF